jgi:long-chain acyl-CoA synthetase
VPEGRTHSYRHTKCSITNSGQISGAFSSFPECFTLRDLFDAMVDRYSGYPMYCDYGGGGPLALTYGEFGALVHRVVPVLLAHGLKAGDIAAVVAENGAYFALAQWALAYIGAAIFPIAPAVDAAAARDMLATFGASAAVCSFRTYGQLAGGVFAAPVASVRRVFVLCDDRELEALQAGRAAPVGAELPVPVFCLPTEMLAPPDAPRKLAAILATTLATLTLGSARRGIWLASCLSHANVIAAAAGLETCDYAFGRDVYLSQIAMSYAFERSMQLAVLAHGGCVGFCEGKLVDALAAARPTIVACRIEGMRDLMLGIGERLARRGALARKLLDVALDVAAQAAEDGAQTPWIVRRAVTEPLRAAVGGRLRLVVSYGWNLDARVQGSLRTMLQVPVIQVYGTTECGGVICVQQVGDARNECVGGPATCCEIQVRDFGQSGKCVANGDPGEILVRGPNVFKGYHRARRRTMDAVLDGGWFRTGDLGRIMEDGSVRIDDRILAWNHRTRT